MKLALLMSVADFSRHYVSFVEGGTVSHIHLNLQVSHQQSEIPVYGVPAIHGMVWFSHVLSSVLDLFQHNGTF